MRALGLGLANVVAYLLVTSVWTRHPPRRRARTVDDVNADDVRDSWRFGEELASWEEDGR